MPGDTSPAPLFASKEMEPQHQNGSAGISKYTYLPLPSSFSPSPSSSSLSSIFSHRLGFLPSGLAKRLAAALFVGLACVVGLSFLLPVRPSSFCTRMKPNGIFLCDFLKMTWC